MTDNDNTTGIPTPPVDGFYYYYFTFPSAYENPDEQYYAELEYYQNGGVGGAGISIYNHTASTWDLTTSGNEGYQTLNLPYGSGYFTSHNFPILLRAQLNQAGSSTSDYVKIMEVDLFAANYTPTIIAPENGSIVNTSYPPLLNDIDFSWHDVKSGIDYWQYDIAEDENYNLIKYSGSTTTNTTTKALSGDDYWFRVRGYSDENGYSNYAEAQFTINATSPDYGGAVQGVVYTIDGNELSNVNVILYNDTYSDTYTTSSNGYYLFDDIGNGTYYLQASKNGYETGSLNIVTVADETITKNIVLEEESAPNYIMPHYVKFVVKSIFGTVHEDVLVTVYEGDSATSIYSSYTGSDGAAGFELLHTERYRVTYYKAGVIDTEKYYTPVDDEYVIYTFKFNDIVDDDSNVYRDIEIDVSKETIDSSDAYINVTYLDSTGNTDDLTIYVNQSNATSLGQDTITSTNKGATSDTSHSFTVTGYSGESYLVVFHIDHADYGNVVRTYSVSFEPVDQYDLGAGAYMWFAAIIILLIALATTEASVPMGAMSVVGLTWVFKGIGFIPQISTVNITVATVLVVAYAFARFKDGEK